MRRIRRATMKLYPGDLAAIYYDPAILERSVPGAVNIFDPGAYSIWDKPPGMLSQGTLFGDHCALVRFAETRTRPNRPVFLVHRIDREASGLIILAHDKNMAAIFSKAFARGTIEKTYQVTVTGNVDKNLGPSGAIELPLDGKTAQTEFQILEYDRDLDRTRLQIKLLTGRRHQIRRHFNKVGHPVVGDPLYGRDNKAHGMRLRASGLKFSCPLNGNLLSFEQTQIPDYPPWVQNEASR